MVCVWPFWIESWRRSWRQKECKFALFGKHTFFFVCWWNDGGGEWTQNTSTTSLKWKKQQQQQRKLAELKKVAFRVHDFSFGDIQAVASVNWMCCEVDSTPHELKWIICLHAYTIFLCIKHWAECRKAAHRNCVYKVHLYFQYKMFKRPTDWDRWTDTVRAYRAKEYTHTKKNERKKGNIKRESL